MIRSQTQAAFPRNIIYLALRKPPSSGPSKRTTTSRCQQHHIPQLYDLATSTPGFGQLRSSPRCTHPTVHTRGTLGPCDTRTFIAVIITVAPAAGDYRPESTSSLKIQRGQAFVSEIFALEAVALSRPRRRQLKFDIQRGIRRVRQLPAFRGSVQSPSKEIAPTPAAPYLCATNSSYSGAIAQRATRHAHDETCNTACVTFDAHS